MTGQVNYGLPVAQVGSETVQVQTVYCGFAAAGVADDDISARIVAPSNQRLEQEPAPR